MAFAPHTNEHVARGARLPLLLGQFRHAETDVLFEYAARPEDGTGFAPEADKVIYVGRAGEETRFARVLKSVAYVAVQETADGQPVWEKWPIKQHRVYETDWVRERLGA